MITLIDTLTFDAKSIRMTADGYAVAEARVARTGIQLYNGREIDPDNVAGLRDRGTIRVYRPADEVFSAAAMKTYAHRPVTIDHPREAVTADNWRQYAAGMTGDEVIRDGEFVRVPMTLMDRQAIDGLRSGRSQLSMGYATAIRIEDGMTPDGQAYDAVQTEMRMNHVALVAAARGGNELKFGDTKPANQGAPMAHITVDGLPVEGTDLHLAIVSRALADRDRRIAAVEKTATDIADAHKIEIAKRDAELAKRDAQIAELAGKVVTDAALDARVAARSALVTRARTLDAKVVTDGKSDAEIRAAVVASVRGGDAVKDKSVDYVTAAFDMLTPVTGADPLRNAISTLPVGATDAASKYAETLKKADSDLNAWRNK